MLFRSVSAPKTLRSASEDVSGQVIDEQGTGYGNPRTRRGGSLESPVSQNRPLFGDGAQGARVATNSQENSEGVLRESR